MPLASYKNYTLWRASFADIGALRRLEREIFPGDAYTSIELALQMILPKTGNYKLVDSTNQVVGFVSTMDSLWGNHPAWIMTLGVSRAYQRQGLGRFLLDWGERRLQAKRVRLTVRAGNLPAITLYESTGYVHVRRVYRYYSGGEDGLIMEKRLD
jgi:ribosomal-protein-alanine N-acetyltransferase